MKRRILVVEDDLTLRQVLTFSLGQEGYEVAGAGDGEAGLAAAQSGRYDLILLDLMLPSMSGLEVLRDPAPGRHLDPGHHPERQGGRGRPGGRPEDRRR